MDQIHLLGKEMISLKVSCSLFRYFCAVCRIPKQTLQKGIGMAYSNLFSTKSIAWVFQMWAAALCNPTIRRHRQTTALYLQTPFVPRCCLPYIIIPSLTRAKASVCCCADRLCLDAGSPKPESPFHGLLLSFASSTERTPWARAISFYVPSCSSCYFCSCKVSVLLTGINLPKLGRPKEMF